MPTLLYSCTQIHSKKNMTHKTITAFVASIIMAVQWTNAAAQGIKETKGSNGKWEVTATFSKKEWPSWLVNSSYNAEPNIAVNHRGEIFVVLLENLGGVSGSVDGHLFVVSPDGKVLGKKDRAFAWDSVSIAYVAADPEGNFWVSVRNTKKWTNTFYRFSPQLNELLRFEAPASQPYFWNGNMLLSINRDAKVLGDSIHYNDKTPLALLTIDYNHAKIVSTKYLPATGSVASTLFVPNADGSFYYIANTTVLAGMDHHDVHLYNFSDKGVLLQHRMLGGQGGMAIMEVKTASTNGQGNLEIYGTTTSPVDFAKRYAYMADTVCKFTIIDMNGELNFIYLPPSKAKLAKDTLGETYETITTGGYNFYCTYSNKLDLVNHKFESTFYDNYSAWHSMSASAANEMNLLGAFPALKKYGKIKYDITPSANESGESPVFRLFGE